MVGNTEGLDAVTIGALEVCSPWRWGRGGYVEKGQEQPQLKPKALISLGTVEPLVAGGT